MSTHKEIAFEEEICEISDDWETRRSYLNMKAR
jgi:hypothetical protein